MTFIRTTAYVLLTGYILAFFSEWMFWSGHVVAPDFISGFIPTWLMYSFISFLFLVAVEYFRVRTIWAIFLAGAIYGWLVEGVVVGTMYDDFPMNISFTGLAWHALISILFGWYMLPRVLWQGKTVARWCIGFGLLLGMWSVGWWSESSPVPLEIVVIYNFVLSFGLILAYVWRDNFSFKINRAAAYVAIALLTAYFLLVTVPAQPLALIVLPPLLILTLVVLRKNRLREGANIMTSVEPHNRITLRQVIPLMLIPLTASLVYGAALATGIAVPGLQIAYIILMPAGFIIFVVSLIKVWRGESIQSI